jgi:hypothetical protein
MEGIIAIAAVILVAIQGHRNYLMIQAAKTSGYPLEATIEVAEQAPPVVNISFEIDYEKLADAFNRQEPTIIRVEPVGIPPVLYPVPAPQPYPNQYPIISDGTSATGNEIEIDGVKGKKFPAR